MDFSRKLFILLGLLILEKLITLNYDDLVRTDENDRNKLVGFGSVLEMGIEALTADSFPP